MFSPSTSRERVIALTLVASLILLLALLPFLTLTGEEMLTLLALDAAFGVYGLALLGARRRWEWQALAPFAVPAGTLLLTIFFACLYHALPLAWLGFLCVPLIVPFLYGRRWAYIGCLLALLGYFGVLAINGGANRTPGEAPSVAGLLLIFTYFSSALADRATREAQIQAALRTLAATVNRSLTLDEICEQALEQIVSLARVDVAAICTVEGNELMLRAQRGLTPEWIAGVRGLRVGEGIVGRVAQSGRTEIVTAGLRDDPRVARQVVRDSDLEALASIPLVARERVVGVLNLMTRRPRQFRADDLALYRAIADHLASAIANAALYDHAQMQARRLALLNEFAALCNRELELEPLLAEAQRLAAELLNLETAWVGLIDETSGTFALAGTYNLPPILAQDDARELRWPFCTCQRKLYAGGFDAPVNIELCERFQKLGLQSYHASVPLKSNDRVLGILNVVKPDGTPLASDDLVTLGAMGVQLGVAIARVQLHKRVKAQRIVEQAALLRLSQELVGLLDADAILDRGAGAAYEIFRPTLVSIMLPDARGEKLVLRAGRGWAKEQYGTYAVEMATSREGAAFRSGEAVQQLQGVEDSARYPCSAALQEHGIQSSLTVPLKTARRAAAEGDIAPSDGAIPLGTLCVHFRERRVFSDDDVRLLSLNADQVALAYERAQHWQAAQRRLARLTALQVIEQAMTSTLNLQERLDVLLEHSLAEMGADVSVVFLLDPEMQELYALAERGSRAPEALRGFRLRVGEGAAGWIVMHNQPLAIPDVTQDPRWVHSEALEREELVSYLGVPLRVQERIIGVLDVATRTRREFASEELEFFTTLAAQAAVAIENARLFEETQAYARDLEGLHGIAQTFQQITTLPELYARISTAVAQLLDAEQCGVVLYDSLAQTFEMQTPAYGLSEAQARAFRLAFTEMEWNLRAEVLQQPFVIIHAPHKHPWVNPRLVDLLQERSLLLARLLLGEQFLGALRVANKRDPSGFSRRDGQLVSILAPTIAVAIENARVLTQAQQRLKRLSTLHQVEVAVTSALRLEERLELVLEHALTQLHADMGGIGLLDPATQELKGVTLRGARDPARLRGFRLKVGEGAAGHIAATNQPLVIADIRHDPRWAHPEITDPEELVTYLGIPLSIQERVIGVLDIATRTPRVFSTEEIEFATILAAQAAVAIENARLLEETQRRARKLEILQSLSRIFLETLDAQRVMDEAVEQAAAFFDVDLAKILLLEPDGKSLRLAAGHGWSTGLVGTARVSAGLDSQAGYTLMTRAPVIVTDLAREERFHGPPLLREHQVVSGLSVPMAAGGRAIGVMGVHHRSPRAFSEEDVEFLTALAAQVAAAIENARLFEERRIAAQQFGLLYDAGLALNQELEPHAQVEYLLKLAQKTVHAATADFFVYDAARQALVFENGIGYGDPEALARLKNTTFAWGEPRGLVGYVAAERVPVYLPDVRADPRYIAFNPTIRCAFWMPVEREGRLFGVLAVLGTRVDGFSPADQRLVGLFANQLAVALENARLLQETRTRAQRLQVLYETARAISRSGDLTQILTDALHHILALLPADAASIYLRDPRDREWFNLVTQIGFSPENATFFARHRAGTQTIIGQTALGECPYLIEEVSRFPYEPEARRVMLADGIVSVAALPLRAQEQVIGVLAVAWRQRHRLDAEALALLEGLADLLTNGIVNIQLLDETRRRAEELALVNQISGAISQSVELNEVLNNLLHGLAQALDADRGAVAIFTSDGPEQRSLQIIAEYNPLGGASVLGQRIPLHNNPSIDRILRERRPLSITDVARDPILGDAAALPRAVHVQSMLIIPLISGEEVIGTLGLDSVWRMRVFGEEEIALAQTVAHHAATALEKARLFENEQARRAELGALYDLARELADAPPDLEVILPLVARRAVETVHVTFARIVLVEGDEFVVRAAYPIRVLNVDLGVGRREPRAAHPYCVRLLTQNALMVIDPLTPDLTAYERETLFLGIARTLCLVPLRVGERELGLLLLGEMRRAEREPFTRDKLRLARSIGDQAASALRRVELFAELESAYLQAVLALATAIDAKDQYTAEHAQRLAEMALAVGRELGLSARELEDLRYGAILHDIGKIGVPDTILQKPAPLDSDEWQQIRRHPEIGAQILAPIPRLAAATRIVRHHHERFDGSGYPDGLRGEEIPLGARILTVVDAFTAMLDPRVYKAARTIEEAVAELQKHSGTQFDPQIVEIFLRLLARGEIRI